MIFGTGNLYDIYLADKVIAAPFYKMQHRKNIQHFTKEKLLYWSEVNHNILKINLVLTKLESER